MPKPKPKPKPAAWRRISCGFRKLFSLSPQHSQPKHKPKISYPQCVQSSAPISPPAHRKLNSHHSKYRPTPAEEDACSDISFTCHGLGLDFRDSARREHEHEEHINDTPSPLFREAEAHVGLRYTTPTTVSVSSEWAPLPGTIVRTDEMCTVCDKLPVRNTTGLCRNCAPLVDKNRVSRWSISDYFRDSFILTYADDPDSPSSTAGVVGTNTNASPSDFGRGNMERDGESIRFRYSNYADLYDTEADHEDGSPTLAPSRRWSNETDVPDRQMLSAAGMREGRNYRSRWSQETEDVPDGNSYYRRY